MRINYAYDATGNVVQEQESRHLQWDAADQLRQFATWPGTNSAPTLLAYYVYDAGGQRTKKLTQTGPDTWQVTVYVDGAFEHRYEVSGGAVGKDQTTLYVLDGQSRLYQRRTGEALGDQRPAELFTLEDHLGSAAAAVDGNGVLVSREEYYPFGETSFGSTDKQRYRFCGKERDTESGLYYYGMRYYAPWLCRFISIDPLAAKYAYYTPYQYAGNKPINAIDLDGAESAPVTPTGGQQATVNTRPNNTVGGADATRVAPRPLPVRVHNAQPPQGGANGQTYVSQTPADRQVNSPASYREYERRNVDYALAQAQAKTQASQQPHEKAMQLGIEIAGAVEGGLAAGRLVTAAPRLLRALSSLGRAEVRVAAEELTPVARSAASEGSASWGSDGVGEVYTAEQVLKMAPIKSPFKPYAEMSESEIQSFNHAISNHGADFGLTWGKKAILPRLVEDFNAAASDIRKNGVFMGVQKKPFGVKGAGKSAESIDVNVYNRTVGGKSYYYYEKLDGTFVSAGLKTR